MPVPVPNLRMALRVWRRNLRVFSKIWRGALLPLFFDPLFYLVAMGFGLGTYIATINGVPYRDFIAPGLCASAVMWASSCPEYVSGAPTTAKCTSGSRSATRTATSMNTSNPR